MNNAHFVRRQLIILGFCIPAGYALIFFPFAIMAVVSVLTRPLFGLAALLALAIYIALGVFAWRRERLAWTLLFLLVSCSPLLGQFIVLPEMQKKHFRAYRHVPDDAKILYYRQSGIRDVTRFCIVQHPTSVPPRSNVTEYRPFLPGALGIMSNVQKELGIPDSKMPDPKKQTVYYSGGSNESAPGGWMDLDVYDSETAKEWLFEYGY